MDWSRVFTFRSIGPLKLFYHMLILQLMFFLKGWQNSLGWSVVVSNKSIQISVLKSTQCSQRTFRDHPHTGPSLSNTLQIHLRQPGVQGSLKHGPFPSCSVLGLEYNIQFVRPCFTFSGRFLLSYHHATKAHAAAKGKEKTGDKTGVNCKVLNGKEQNNTVSFPLLR